MTADDLALLRRQIVRVAQGNLGYGEEGGNNRGPFLKAIGAPQGSEWCAYFAWYCYRRGAEYAEVDLPFKGSGNAKRLGLAVGNVILSIAPPVTIRGPVLPGDLVVLHRGTSKYTGHVRVVESVLPDGRLAQIEGNSGGFPAVVRRRTTDITKERLVAVYGLR